MWRERLRGVTRLHQGVDTLAPNVCSCLKLKAILTDLKLMCCSAHWSLTYVCLVSCGLL